MKLYNNWTEAYPPEWASSIECSDMILSAGWLPNAVNPDIN